MMWLKACPRCKAGDMFLEQDGYGAYRQCLQCGHLQELVPQTGDGQADSSAPAVDSAALRNIMAGLPLAG